MEVTKPTNSAMTGITLNVLEDFDDIKSRHKIGDELFQKGLKFAMLISEGKEKKLAYMIAFDEEDKHMANVRANQLARTKWCGSLIDRIICGNHITHTWAPHSNRCARRRGPCPTGISPWPWPRARSPAW